MGYPGVTQVRAWLKLSPTAMSDAELTTVMAAEQISQMHMCRVPQPDGQPPAPADDQVGAFYRRCARAVAARGIPLGLMQDAEYGPARLPMFDAEIERLEGPTRRVVFA